MRHPAVTVTKRLRPEEMCCTVVAHDASTDAVQVSYSIIASEYHDRTEGETFTVPVEEQDMFGAIEVAMDASDKSKQ